MARLIIVFILSLCYACNALAQTDDSKINKAAENGEPLPVRINVGGNVTASAVLIPRVDARRIFGKEIADNYAVVEVNVGNKSPDASLILHSIFIDYSGWALSGSTGPLMSSKGAFARQNSDPFQATTSSSQVASEEYRVVRGQLLDAQMWSRRNWTMRLLTFAGNLAGAYAFSISEKGIVKGLNAFSGVFVPGLREVWPDGTIEQLNRVSDFGFRSNQVIPRQGSEIIVCFFPIDRFLTPGFKKLFLKSPALFFAPFLMLQDKTISKDVAKVLVRDLGIKAETIGATDGDVLQRLRDQMPCYTTIIQQAKTGFEGESVHARMKRTETALCLSQFGLKRATDADGQPNGDLELKDTTPQTQRDFASFAALDFISQASLNNVSVTIDGAMTVDVTAVAAKIDDVKLDDVASCGDDQQACFWSAAVANGVRTGTITGSYLTGGSVSIAEANGLSITEVNTISDGSDDQHLRFTFKLTKGVRPGSLTFKVAKPRPGTNTKVESNPFTHAFGFSPVAPKVTGVEQKGNKLTVRGENFLDLPAFPLMVTLHPPSGDDVMLDASGFTIKSLGELELDIPAEADTPGCWQLSVDLKTPLNQVPSNNTFVVGPSIDSARLDGNEIVVEGSGLDALDCDGAMATFRLIHEGQTFKLQKEKTSTASVVRFKLPAAAKPVDATWKVQAQFGGQELGDGPVPLQAKPN